MVLTNNNMITLIQVMIKMLIMRSKIMELYDSNSYKPQNVKSK